MTDEPDWVREARESYDRAHKVPASREDVDLDAIEIEEVAAAVPQAPADETAVALLDDPDEQLTIDPGEIIPIHYEHLLDSFSVSTYKRVKRQTMEIATVARELIAELVGGTVGDGMRSRKEFVTTRLGQYRISMSYASDNSTEVAAHERMQVGFVHLSDPSEVMEFFRVHGLDGEEAYRRLYANLKARRWA